MPRTYVKKKESPRYTLEDVKRAVDDVTNKRKTFRDASENYGVPTAVIFHRIKGRKVSLDRMGGGVTKALPDRVEQHLVNCLKRRALMGHPCHKEELKQLVGEYVTKLKIKTPFKNNIPGDCWYQNFMKRNPCLSLKKPELLQKSRTDARRPHVIYDFYDLLSKEVQDNNLKDKPRYIYNADESGFHNDPCRLRAIGEKGKALSRVTGGSGRESTSVLACVAADGTYLPPCIVFKGAAVQARWISDKAYPGTLFAATKNGWMEEPTFHNWLVNGFIPYIENVRKVNNEPDHKVILIYDGHSSHISVRIVEDAIKANIILIKFPSHLTDRIQPLDKCVFGPVKTYWDKALVEHGVKQMGKGSAHLSKEQFTELLGEVWEQAFTSKNIISGFSTTGVYPVDATKFPKKLFNANELKIYHDLVNAINGSDIVDGVLQDNIEECATASCSSSEIPADSVPSKVIIDENDNANCSSFEKPLDSAPTGVTVDEHSTANCSSLEITMNDTLEKENIDECVTGGGSSIVISADNTPTRVNVADYDICGSSFQHYANSVTDEVCAEPITLQRDYFEKHPNSATTTSATCESSSGLLNKILKLVSLDTTTNETVKARILNAILVPKETEVSPDEIISPNKETLHELFKIQKKTPEKNKKIVIPRLKVATYGEVLTCDAVKERLKKAEEEKKRKGPKKTIKVEKDLKIKCQGKRTKCTKKDAHENKQKKPRFDEKCDTRKEKKRSESESDSEEEEFLVSYADSDNSEYNVECEFETAEDCEFLEIAATDNLMKGNFVIAKFRGGKRLTASFRYLCMVDSVDEMGSEIVVTSLKSVDSTKKVFAVNETDISSVPIEDVIGVLPEPVITLKGERIYYKFPKAVDIHEKV